MPVRLCECACASDTVLPVDICHQTVKRLYVCIHELQVLVAIMRKYLVLFSLLRYFDVKTEESKMTTG